MANSYAAYGSVLNVEKLTMEVRSIAQPALAFHQAAVPPSGDAMGLGEGDTVKYTFVPNIASKGGQISESERIPSTGITPIEATATLAEWGNSIEYTGKLKLLSKIDAEDLHIQALVNDYKKVMNTGSKTEFAKTKWQAVMHSTPASREFVQDGTPTVTQNTDLDLGNLGFVRTKAEEENIPFWDGESYLGIVSPASAENLANDSTLSTLMSRDAGGGRDILNNEIGRVKETRLVKDNQDLAVSTGSFKEWFLCGSDCVVHEVALPVEIRAQDDDFGRSLAIAYYEIGVFFKTLSQDVHSREHIIKVTSA